MSGFNSVVLVGRLTADPDVRTTKSGKSVASFTVAVDKYKDGTNFIDCEAWEAIADYMRKYLKKGNQVLASGSLEQSIWEKDGKKQSKLFVSVRTLQSLSSASVKQEDKEEPEIEDEQIDYTEVPF